MSKEIATELKCPLCGGELKCFPPDAVKDGKTVYVCQLDNKNHQFWTHPFECDILKQKRFDYPDEWTRAWKIVDGKYTDILMNL